MKLFRYLGLCVILFTLSQPMQAQILISSTKIPTPVKCLALSPDGKYFAAGGVGESMVFDSSGKVVKKLPFGASVLQFSPDSKTLLTGSILAGLFLWGAGPGPFLSAYMTDEERSEVTALAFSPDGQQIIAGYHSGNLRSWSTFKHEVIELVAKPKPTEQPAGQADEDLDVGMIDGDFLASDEDAGSSFLDLLLADTLDQSILSIVLSNDNKTVLFCKKGAPELFKISNGVQTTLIKDTLSAIQQITFSPDQKTVVTGHENGKICYWTAAGKLVKSIKGSNAPVLALGYSKNGKKLFSVLASGKVMVYDPQGRLLKELQPHTPAIKTISAAAFMPNGKLVLADNESTTVELWALPLN